MGRYLEKTRKGISSERSFRRGVRDLRDQGSGEKVSKRDRVSFTGKICDRRQMGN